MIVNPHSTDGRCIAHLIAWLSFALACANLDSQAHCEDANGSVNLIPNSSFECGSVGWRGYPPQVGTVGSLWKLHGDVIEVDDAPHGKMVLSLSVGAPVSMLGLFKANASAVNVLIASSGWIKLCAGRTYTLSAFMRSDCDAIATLMLRYRSGDSHGRQFKPSNSWRRYSFTFVAREEFASVVIAHCRCEGWCEAGSIFVDAIQLECGDAPSAYRPLSQFELFITSNSPANVWVNSGDAKLCLVGYNDGADSDVSIDVRAYDFNGVAVSHREVRTKALMASRIIVLLHDVLPKAFGFYLVRAHAYDDSRHPIANAEARCAVLRRFDGVDSPFGAEDVHACGELLLLAKRAGLLWRKIRLAEAAAVGAIGDGADVNAKVDLALKLGVHPLLSISTNQLSRALEGCEVGDEGGLTGECVESSQAVRAKRLAELFGVGVRRYRTRVVAFELIHPVLPHAACSRQRDLQCGGYIELMKAAYSIAKGLCRDCLLLGGISAGEAEAALEFANEFIASGGLKFVDALAVEIRSAQIPSEALEQLMKKLLAQIDARGGRKPIWLTWYWSLSGKGSGAQPLSSPQDELEMGICMVRLVAILLSYGVGKIFHASGCAPSGGHLGDLFFEVDGTPKVTLPMHAALANFLTSSPLPLGVLNLGSRSRCYAFRTRNGVTAIAWLADETANAHLSLGRAVKAYDIMGNEIATSKVKLSRAPIYLSSPAKDLRSLASMVHFRSDKSR